MALSISITDDMLKETSALFGGLDSVKWPGDTDTAKVRAEGLRQVKNALTQSGIDSDDIAADDASLKFAIIYKTLSILFYGLMRRPGDVWEERSLKFEREFQDNFRSAIITLDTGSTTTAQGRATR